LSGIPISSDSSFHFQLKVTLVTKQPSHQLPNTYQESPAASCLESSLAGNGVSNSSNSGSSSSFVDGVMLLHFAVINHDGLACAVKTEKRYFISCPWCTLHQESTTNPLCTTTSTNSNPLQWEKYQAGFRLTKQSHKVIQRLAFHLKHTHLHFTYEWVLDDNFQVHVIIRRIADTFHKNERFRPFTFFRSKSISSTLFKRISTSDLQKFNRKNISNEENSFIKKSKNASGFVKKKQSTPAAPLRAYYSPLTGQRLSEEECQHDTDDNIGIHS